MNTYISICIQSSICNTSPPQKYSINNTRNNLYVSFCSNVIQAALYRTRADLVQDKHIMMHGLSPTLRYHNSCDLLLEPRKQQP